MIQPVCNTCPYFLPRALPATNQGVGKEGACIRWPEPIQKRSSGTSVCGEHPEFLNWTIAQKVDDAKEKAKKKAVGDA